VPLDFGVAHFSLFAFAAGMDCMWIFGFWTDRHLPDDVFIIGRNVIQYAQMVIVGARAKRPHLGGKPPGTVTFVYN